MKRGSFLKTLAGLAGLAVVPWPKKKEDVFIGVDIGKDEGNHAVCMGDGMKGMSPDQADAFLLGLDDSTSAIRYNLEAKGWTVK